MDLSSRPKRYKNLYIHQEPNEAYVLEHANSKQIMFIIDGENRNDLEAELSDNPWLRGRVEYFNNNGTTGKVMAG